MKNRRPIPAQLIRSLAHRLGFGVRTFLRPESLPSYNEFARLMDRYVVGQLVGVTASAFRQRIDAFLESNDWKDEALQGPDGQREQTVRFTWGHNHNFGDFELSGQMENRHVQHLAVFSDVFGALPANLEGKRVLDIGCWTGGVSLLLCALGAEVVALDEVRKYVECLQYLRDSFGLNKLTVEAASLYDIGSTKDFCEAFDMVLFCGVLYHLTDPILALRHTFNALKDGGVCLLETTGIPSSRPLLSYERRRWNWFDLSPSALNLMMTDVGYSDVDVGKVTQRRRIYATGRRDSHKDMRRDGLSVPTVR